MPGPATEDEIPTDRAVPVCGCGSPATADADRTGAVPVRRRARCSRLAGAPLRAVGSAAKSLVGRLPLWARVAGGVALWAIAYHYWLPVATWLSQDVLSLGDRRFGSALEFFIYDTVKVLLLLTDRRLRRRHRALVLQPRAYAGPAARAARERPGNVLAASLGIVTPFCSCSAVPLFIGFVEAGIPLGVTLLVPHRRADGQRDRARPAVSASSAGRSLRSTSSPGWSSRWWPGG